MMWCGPSIAVLFSRINWLQICPNCAVAQHELFAAIDHCKDDLKLPLEFQVEFLPFRLINTKLLPQDYEPKVSKIDFFNNIFGEENFAKFQETIGKWSVEKSVPMWVTRCALFRLVGSQ